MVGRRLASGGRIDRGRPHLGPENSGEQTFPGDSPTAVFVASGAMVARTSATGQPRGVIRDGEIPGPILGFAGPAGDPGPACDVLVVGAGPAGLAAALTAARTGLHVILVDRAAGPGGAMLTDAEVRWAQETVEELAGLGTELLLGTEVEQLSPGAAPVPPVDDGGGDRPDDRPDGDTGVEVSVRHGAGRRHRITAGRVVLATGAVERPALFPGNGAPGVMPAEAVRAFLLRYGVLAGEQVVLLAGDDDAYRVAGDLLAVGAAVAIVDPRPDPGGEADATFPGKSYDPVPTGTVLHRAAVTGVVTDDAGVLVGVRLRGSDGTGRAVPADLLAVAGGWNPALTLFTAYGGRVVFDPARGAYLPESDLDHLHVVGAARGLRTNAECVADGAGAGALKGLSGELVVLPPPVDLDPARTPPAALPITVAATRNPGDVLIDPAGDLTVADVLRSSRAAGSPADREPGDASPEDRLAHLLAAPAAGLPMD